MEERRKQVEDELTRARKELDEKLNKKKNAESSTEENAVSSYEKTEARTDMWSLPQLSRRKTPSIQKFASERDENEQEGSYKSKRREVEYHFKRITGITTRLKDYTRIIL